MLLRGTETMLREADDFISSMDGQEDWRAGSFETSKLEEIDKTLMNRSDSALGDGVSLGGCLECFTCLLNRSDSVLERGVSNGGCSGKPPGAGTKADGRIS